MEDSINICIIFLVNQCQVRWTRLREKYSKERKQRQNETRSGSGISNRVVWPLYDSMKFFEKHIAKRKYVHLTLLFVYSQSQ